MHRKLYAVLLAVFALSVITYAKAQTGTQPTTQDEILGAVRENLNRTQTLRIAGNADSTLNTESISNNIVFRMIAPQSWINMKRQLGLGFDGTLNLRQSTTTATQPGAPTTTTSTPGVMTRWEITPYSRPFVSGTSTTETGTTSTGTPFTVVTSDGILYISAPEFIGSLEDRGFLSPTSTITSTDWVRVDVENFLERIDRIAGTDLEEVFEERRNVIISAVNDPGSMFTVQNFTSTTLDGRSVYRFDIQGNGRFLGQFYPNVTSTGGNLTTTRTATGTLWVDRETLLPTRLTFNAQLVTDSEVRDRFNLEANFSEFDQPVNITIPTVFRTIESLLREFFQRLANMFPGDGTTPTSTPGTTSTPPTTTE